mmetsp:Transcript_33810/g.66954  ORF Transcript_33810/g.66954 Transcript_33810/m.66954 type:complete len:315 (-) Transcript_33810:44-988(-)
MDEIPPKGSDAESAREVCIVFLARVQVQREDLAAGRVHHPCLHVVHQGVLHHDRLHRAEVEPVDVVPLAELLLSVVCVLYARQVEGGLVGKDQTAFLQPLVSAEENGIEHTLVKEEIAHPLRDDDVNLVHRERHLLSLACDELHNVVIVVVRNDLPRDLHDFRALDAVYLLCSRLGSEQRENTAAGPNVQNRFASEQVSVLKNGLLISARSHGVLQHLLMNPKMRIRVEVVVGRANLFLCERSPLLRELCHLPLGDCFLRLSLLSSTPTPVHPVGLTPTRMSSIPLHRVIVRLISRNKLRVAMLRKEQLAAELV